MSQKLKILIIEDEPFAQDELKRLLAKAETEMKILDCLDTVEDSVIWFGENESPDLVFCDIQLADGISFDIFNRVKVTAPVIFTTAFDEYAIKAFQVNSIDYLLKPIELENLKKAISKFKRLKQQFDSEKESINPEQIKELIELTGKPKEYKSRILIKVGEQFKFIKTPEIAYFYAESNEVSLITFKNKEYIVEHSLNELSEQLNPKDFFRINRSYITNIESINKIHKYFNSRLKIDLIPPRREPILISRVKVSEFLNWIER